MMLNVHELSKELEISESGIYQWVSQRRIPFVKMGRSLRFDSEEIRAWVEVKKVKPKDISLKPVQNCDKLGQSISDRSAPAAETGGKYGTIS
jgi:excisionase family DNA binding protein